MMNGQFTIDTALVQISSRLCTCYRQYRNVCVITDGL